MHPPVVLDTAVTASHVEKRIIDDMPAGRMERTFKSDETHTSQRVSRNFASSMPKNSFQCSKSGCITCRIRRVKCDEQRPVCMQCYTTGRRCDGYTVMPLSRKELLAASSSAGQSPNSSQSGSILNVLASRPDFTTTLEARCFELFCGQTIIKSNRWIDSRFWNRTVLPLTRANSSVKHATIALGALHVCLAEHQHAEASSSGLYEFAFRQYHKSSASLIHIISQSKGRNLKDILIAALLLAAFDYSRHELHAYKIHMSACDNLIMSLQQSSRPLIGSTLEACESLHRLKAASLAFECLHPREPSRSSSTAVLEDSFDTKEFDSISDARSSLIGMVNRFTSAQLALQELETIEHEDPVTVEHHLQQQTGCAILLKTWRDAFEGLLARTSSTDTMPQQILWIWWNAAIIAAEATSRGPETRYDTMKERFTSICDLTESLAQSTDERRHEPAFVIDAGCIPPLWFVATKCREPITRRRAVHLLRSLDLIEGALSSLDVAIISERAINLEEKDLRSVLAASDVPESNRLRRGEFLDTTRGREHLHVRFFPSSFARPTQGPWDEWLRRI